MVCRRHSIYISSFIHNEAVEPNISAQLSNLSLASTAQTSGSGSASPSATSPPTSMSTASSGSLRVAHLTEQISHNPPISMYIVSCLTRHITLSGIDQISIQVLSSASLRVASETMNKGLFVNIDDGPGAGERCHITHPVAHVSTLLCTRAPL